jgi:hypothetical protein
LKKVGKGAVSVAKMPAGVAKRVAAASASVLCDKDGNPRGTDSTSVNYCRAVKLKRAASLRKYLPGAAAAASRAAALKTAYQAPMEGFAGGGKYSRATPCQRAQRTWRGGDGRVAWASESVTARGLRRACGAPATAAEYASSRGLSNADTNLLAGLAGADQNELAFALAGVTPVDIQGVTTSDVAMFAPSLIAVAAGLWMLAKG